MGNVFLVHGSYGKPFENWFPWLESQMSERGIDCVVPTFPTPAHQDYGSWAELVDYYRKTGVVNSDTVLIGHSCGAIFLVGYLIDRQIEAAGLITVSGYNNFISGNDGMDALNSPFYRKDDELFVGDRVREVHSFLSDDDPFIPASHLHDFANRIGARAHVVSGAGHFNAAAGYTKFDEVLQLVLNLHSLNAG